MERTGDSSETGEVNEHFPPHPTYTQFVLAAWLEYFLLTLLASIIVLSTYNIPTRCSSSCLRDSDPYMEG